jgi:LacI family transcriptional regulator
VTLTEVANRAGVSLTTASKAINGQPRVSADARTRVLKAAKELAYTPNPVARSLLSGRSGTVALLIIDRHSRRWAVPAILGVESALQRVELSMVVADADGDADRLRALALTYQARKVDGLLVLGDNNFPTPSLRGVVSLPVVYLHGQTGDPRDVCHVPDDRGGAELALDHLHAMGRRRVAHITGPDGVRAVTERAEGALARGRQVGLPLLAPVRYGEWSQRWGRQAADQLLREQPDVDAVLCGSDQIAYGVVLALQAAGRRVPEDIAVTGYDNWTAFALEIDPTLTTVDMEPGVLGASAVRDLYAIIDSAPGDRSSVGGGVRCHASSLIVRGSSDPAAYSPPGC